MNWKKASDELEEEWRLRATIKIYTSLIPTSFLGRLLLLGIIQPLPQNLSLHRLWAQRLTRAAGPSACERMAMQVCVWPNKAVIYERLAGLIQSASAGRA